MSHVFLTLIPPVESVFPAIAHLLSCLIELKRAAANSGEVHLPLHLAPMPKEFSVFLTFNSSIPFLSFRLEAGEAALW